MDLGSGGVVLFSPEGSGKQLIAQAGERLWGLGLRV
jgi:hypothetical protein